MVMPVWLFQRPHPKSKDKDHIPRLEDKLSKWHEGDVVSSSMKVRPSKTVLGTSHKGMHMMVARLLGPSKRLVAVGDVKAALRLV